LRVSHISATSPTGVPSFGRALKRTTGILFIEDLQADVRPGYFNHVVVEQIGLGEGALCKKLWEAKWKTL
jgi:hypothetical protein